MFFDNFHGVSSLVYDRCSLVGLKFDLHGCGHVRFPGCLSIKLDHAAIVGEEKEDEDADEGKAGFVVGSDRHYGK